MIQHKPGFIVIRFERQTTHERIDQVLKKHPVKVSRMLVSAKAATLECEIGREEELCIAMSLEPEVDYTKRMEMKAD